MSGGVGAPALRAVELPAGGGAGELPLEHVLATPGTGGGRRRAGLRTVALGLAGRGVTAVGLVVEGPVASGEAGVRVRPLERLGASLEWVGDGLLGPELGAVARDFVAQAPPPGSGPAVWTLGADVVVDLSIGGRRPAFCILRGPQVAARPLPVELLPPRRVLVGVAGMLRADAWRRRIERLVGTLAEAAPAPGGPVTSPQEAAVWAAEEAERLLAGACAATAHRAGSLHLPDPDDGLVWELGGSAAGTRSARHGGVCAPAPTVPAFDWIAAEAMAPVGGGALVRRIDTVETLRAQLAARGLPPLAAGERGPWTLGRRALAPSWSPSRRNLVMVLHGRSAGAAWSEPAELGPLNADEQLRLTALLERVHDRVLGALEGGLARWRDTLRGAVLGEQERQTGPTGLARTLAAGLGAQAVSTWQLRGERLVCVGAGGALEGVALPEFSLSDELIDPREHGLLHRPAFPARGACSEEGFLLWAPLCAALGGPPANVGTVPLRRGGRTVALLRVDGVRPLLASLPSGPGARELRRWLPERVPAHARAVLEELARWLVLPGAPRQSDRARPSETLDWKAFVAAASAGLLGEAEVQRRLEDLARAAGTRTAAAALLGVHRNTFRRQLQAIARQCGAAGKWPGA